MDSEMANEPVAQKPRRGRPPSTDKALREIRKEIGDEKRAREARDREVDETLGLLKDFVLKGADAPAEVARSEAVQAAGITEASIISLIRAYSKSDDRRPDYEPLRGPEREALDKVDPLYWIDESVQSVRFVARTALLTLRNRHVLQSGVKINKLRLSKRLSAPWANCPYFFGGRTPQDADTNALHNSIWHFFELTVRDATEMWTGRDPFPLEVVVRMQDLEEARATGEIFGKKVRSSGIALREGARKILQTHRQIVWFNTDFYSPNWDGRYWGEPYNMAREKFPRRVHPGIDPREPNPYSTGCPGQTAGPRGHVLVPLGPEAGMLNQGPSASNDINTLLRRELAEHVMR